MTVIDSIPPNYVAVESDFNLLGYFKIFLFINGKKYAFGFDTGMGGSLLFSSKNIDNNIKKVSTRKKVYGNVFQVGGGGSISDTVLVKKADKVKIGSNSYVDDVEILIAPENMENLVGVTFMKNYNWTIDYINRNVYVKPRITKIDKSEPSYSDSLEAVFNFAKNPITIRTIVINGKLHKAGLKMGDEILSINNKKITEIPVCKREKFVKKLLKSHNRIVFKVKRNKDFYNFEVDL